MCGIEEVFSDELIVIEDLSGEDFEVFMRLFL